MEYMIWMNLFLVIHFSTKFNICEQWIKNLEFRCVFAEKGNEKGGIWKSYGYLRIFLEG